MNRLWAPWRSAYITMKRPRRCIFCIGASTARDRERYVLTRGAHAFSMLNRYPYNGGHVMIVPYRHTGSLERLSARERAEMMELLAQTKRTIDRLLKPHGFNIGMNLGKVAGAGFGDHVHMHIVPRWSGDTNFMPVNAGVKVISSSLDAMYALLRGGRRC